MMGGACASCGDYLPQVNAALTAASMSCPNSIAAFTALVRHDSSALTVLQDGTFGGALRLPPQLWRSACRATSVLSDTFKVSFPSCGTAESDPCACGSDSAGAAIVARPEFAFRVAAHWFSAGANESVGSPCTDLREDAEAGVGVRGATISTSTPGSGFQKILHCKSGFTDTADNAQLVRFYENAQRVFTPSFSAYDASHPFVMYVSDLLAATGNDCDNCANNLPHLNAALAERSMQTPLRTAAFVAVAQQASDSFRTLHVVATDYAGAVPIAPEHQRQACVDIATLKSAFELAFVGCADVGTAPCTCGSDTAVAGIVKRPEHAFRVAAWWFAVGADTASPASGVCGDLRLLADAGEGVQEAVPSPTYPGTGFHRVTGCASSFAAGFAAAVPTQVANYQTVRRIFVPGFTAAANPHAACTAAASALTEANLNTIMGAGCGNCGSHLAHINAALTEAGAACPLRAAAVLSAIRHDVAPLASLSRGSDDAAGAVLLQPTQFRTACAAIPALATAFATAFPSCGTKDSTPCQCGTNAEAAAVVARPEHAYRVAVWWVVHGAAADRGAPCIDGRTFADAGKGAAGSGSQASPGTGFHATVTCTAGFGTAQDLPNRLKTYTIVRRIFDADYYDAAVDTGIACASTCSVDEVEVVACSSMAPSTCGVSTPIVSPSAGTSPLTVDVFSATPSATAVYVSRDGSTPSCSGGGTATMYPGTGGSLQVFDTETIRTIACGGSGVSNSAVASVVVTIHGMAVRPAVATSQPVTHRVSWCVVLCAAWQMDRQPHFLLVRLLGSTGSACRASRHPTATSSAPPWRGSPALRLTRFASLAPSPARRLAGCEVREPS